MDIKVVRKHISFDHFVVTSIALLMLCLSVACGAQNNAVRFQFDNDWLTDQYYTAGLELTYHRTFNNLPGNKPTDLNKSLNLTAKYGFKIFTPNVYDEESFNEMSQDRPFAGYQYIGLGIQKFSSSNNFQSYELLIGQVGPQTGMEAVQRAAHRFAGYEPIFGWKNQIVDETVIDFQYRWVKEWQLDKTVAVSVINGLQIGTSSNYLQTGINIRTGAIGNLITSNWLRPSLSSSDLGTSKNRNGSFLISGLRAKYVLSNLFLEGSLFDNSSPEWIAPRSVVIEGDLGLMFNINKTSAALTGVFQGREFDGGKGHFYLNFNIARSF